MKVLVINAGSSSLKYQLIDMDAAAVLAKGLCERIGIYGSNLQHKNLVKTISVKVEQQMNDHADAIRMVVNALINPDHGVIASMDEIGAVGHRVVHGGEYFADSFIIDGKVKEALKKCIPLAPLHNPPNITGIEACEKIMPGIPQVAVFDTAFHQTMPPEAYMYALPYGLYEKYKIRKYGFHGTSHKYVAGEAAKMLGRPLEELKLITCHLGNGSSVAAVKYGKCVDTSMGFTPLDGVVMGTRSGSMDPAVVTFLMESEHMNPTEMNTFMNKKCGVLGVSGVSSDFRDLTTAAQDGNEHAQLALDMFYYSVKKYIGAYAAVMGGVDAVVFTAGVGENDAPARARIIEGLEFMGIKADPEKNAKRGVQIDVSTEDAAVKTLVIPTNEELMIALDTKRLVEG
ncbi:MAG TPA: acetate kinase [Candidatus Avimonoglobus intestinipullorum]|uniref:Acetate kinase n=1 Tax=Candidatus Avimonoglobus intestinipullorum TaxID=2840699 RepID=A0A9D1LTE8_9FIRM|nr:acetate kinase [Candidatus Avimonoglobus intestinipullorum]